MITTTNKVEMVATAAVHRSEISVSAVAMITARHSKIVRTLNVVPCMHASSRVH